LWAGDISGSQVSDGVYAYTLAQELTAGDVVSLQVYVVLKEPVNGSNQMRIPSGSIDDQPSTYYTFTYGSNQPSSEPRLSFLSGIDSPGERYFEVLCMPSTNMQVISAWCVSKVYLH
jgi:hypothetical protein